MKTLRKIFVVFLIPVLLAGCFLKKKDARLENTWLHRYPYSLVYKHRKHKFDRGNLLIDYSFENSKPVLHDTVNKSFLLKGWDKTGPEVQLIDISSDSTVDKSEVFHGKKSIKIHRTVADETDKLGYGISSDYIKVIPGEYTLSCYLRLKNIRNPKQRIGCKLNDAINIKVIYYDKNKSEVSSKDFLEDEGYYIDKSFKAISYANFWEIDSIPWHKFIGKASYPPYHDAILSHDIKFVRIFIGLKGHGTMWVDAVSFKYSDNNLTIKEKLSRYKDKIPTKYDLLIPSPKEVKGLESLKLIKDNKLPVIVKPAVNDELSSDAINRLEKSIRENLETDNSQQIVSNTLPDDKTIDSGRLIFCLGKNELHDKYKDHLPYEKILGKSQGYFISTISDLPNVVFISGNTSAGIYYGVLTAIQLFDKERELFYNANIIDYPDCSRRSVMISGMSGDMHELTELDKLKINSYYLPYDNVRSNYQKTIPKLRELSEISRINLFSEPYFPTMFSDSLESDTCNPDEIRVIEQDDLTGIARYINSNNGLFDGFLYMARDIPPLHNCSKTEEKEHDVNDYHYDFFMRIYSSVLDKNLEMSFLPSYCNNQLMDLSYGAARLYYKNLTASFPSHSSLIWAGNAKTSGNIDEAEIYRIKSLLNKSIKLVFLDNSFIDKDLNTLLASDDSANVNLVLVNGLIYPYKPGLDNTLIRHFSYPIVNTITKDKFDLIRSATVAEYFWNKRSYNPDKTLYKILVSYYGHKGAQDLIRLNDLYLNMKLEMRNLEKQKNVNKQFKQIELMLGNYRNIRVTINDSRMKEILIVFDKYINEIERNLSILKKHVKAEVSTGTPDDKT